MSGPGDRSQAEAAQERDLPRTPDADDAFVERLQKILALGKRGGTEHEAAAAMAKVQELCQQRGLTIAQVERHEQVSARREEASAAGGMYEYQRELWRAIAELNNCIYFRHGEFSVKRGKRRWRSKHCFVGRVVNTRATLAMGGYLEQTIERLCRERLQTCVEGWSQPQTAQSQFFSGWAVSFREGVADRVIEKLHERHRRTLSEERRRMKEAAAASGASTKTALTLTDVAEAEYAENYDFVHGKGSWEAILANRAERAREREAEERAWTEFKRANPDEARRQEEQARKERRRRSFGRSPRERAKDWGAYSAGKEAGARVGLDRQADRTPVAGVLT